jgi:hypothetical protein
MAKRRHSDNNHPKTYVGLQRYVDVLHRDTEKEIDALKQTIDDKFKLNSEAVNRATDVLDERLKSMNEFRAQLNAERVGYVTREIFESKLDAIGKRVERLENQQSFWKGRDAALVTIFSVITVVIGVVIKLVWH